MTNKKKKIDLVWVVLIVLLAGIGILVFNSGVEDTINKERFIKFDEKIKNGVVKTFTDEEIERFKNKALEKQEKFIQSGLKPGEYLDNGANEVIYNAFQELGYTDITFEDVEYDTFVGTHGGSAYSTFRDNYVTFYEVMNENFELKKPFIFYGATSVGEKFRDYNSDNVFSYTRPKFYNEFVPALKYFDENYKNSDGSAIASIIKKAVLGKTTDFFNSTLSLDVKKNPSPLYRLAIKKYNDGQKMTSILPLITYLNFKPMYFNFFNDVPVKNYPNYEPFPEKYNYFAENNNYYTIYYPTSIEKIDDKAYVVNVTSELPLTPAASAYISREIETHFFNDRSMPYECKGYEDVPFMLYIKINDNNNLSNGILYDYPVVNVSKNLQIKNNSLDSQYSLNYGKPEWYPNEEAQAWIKDFFAELSVSLEENSNFSIFDTIKEISDKYQKEYNDVENVILSYYWAHIV